MFRPNQRFSRLNALTGTRCRLHANWIQYGWKTVSIDPWGKGLIYTSVINQTVIWIFNKQRCVQLTVHRLERTLNVIWFPRGLITNGSERVRDLARFDEIIHDHSEKNSSIKCWAEYLLLRWSDLTRVSVKSISSLEEVKAALVVTNSAVSVYIHTCMYICRKGRW